MKAEYYFTVVLAMVAGLMAVTEGWGRELQIMDLLVVSSIRTAVFFALAFSFLTVLRGFKHNVVNDIFDNGNYAAAIFSGLALVALALAIK